MSKQKFLFYWVLGFIFVLGIFFRTVGLGYRDCFEDDECRLILAFLNKNWFQIFLSIGDAQSAPPLFILIKPLEYLKVNKITKVLFVTLFIVCFSNYNLFKWSEGEEIIKKYQDRGSYLLLVKRRV